MRGEENIHAIKYNIFNLTTTTTIVATTTTTKRQFFPQPLLCSGITTLSLSSDSRGRKNRGSFSILAAAGAAGETASSTAAEGAETAGAGKKTLLGKHGEAAFVRERGKKRREKERER